MGEATPCWGTGDPDQMLAGRALDLSSRMLDAALQGLITMGAIKLEFGHFHSICLAHWLAFEKSAHKNLLPMHGQSLHEAGRFI